MNYQESLKFIEESHKFGIRLGLENSLKLLDLMGNPQEKLKIIHVAGTNGKGSVCSFIANSLQAEGYKVGLYTSPYLETFTERIRINGQNIPEEDVAICRQNKYCGKNIYYQHYYAPSHAGASFFRLVAVLHANDSGYQLQYRSNDHQYRTY